MNNIQNNKLFKYQNIFNMNYFNQLRYNFQTDINEQFIIE